MVIFSPKGTNTGNFLLELFVVERSGKPITIAGYYGA